MKEVFAYFANIHPIEARDYTEIEKIAFSDYREV